MTGAPLLASFAANRRRMLLVSILVVAGLALLFSGTYATGAYYSGSTSSKTVRISTAAVFTPSAAPEPPSAKESHADLDPVTPKAGGSDESTTPPDSKSDAKPHDDGAPPTDPGNPTTPPPSSEASATAAP
jgi:hypothetical protein